jgi:hypothetical protein
MRTHSPFSGSELAGDDTRALFDPLQHFAYLEQLEQLDADADGRTSGAIVFSLGASFDEGATFDDGSVNDGVFDEAVTYGEVAH